MDGKGSKDEKGRGGRSRRAVGGVGWGVISGPDSATECLDDFGVVSSLLGPQFPHVKTGQKFLPRLSHSPVEQGDECLLNKQRASSCLEDI